jgi:hypothetical protein
MHRAGLSFDCTVDMSAAASDKVDLSDFYVVQELVYRGLI